jgi:hemerythrin superfamily protein
MRSAIFLSFFLAPFLPLNAIAVTNNTDTDHSQISVQKENLNAIEVILQDHKQIKKMIAQLEKSLDSDTAKSRTDFQELKTFLENHENMEQKEWYPELEKHNELKDIIKKLKDEEETAGAELKNLVDVSDDKAWKIKVKKLFKDVKNHAHDEETKLFPKVKKVLDKSSLEEIGKKMEDYKKQQ